MTNFNPKGWLYTLRGIESYSPTRLPHCIALGWREIPLYEVATPSTPTEAQEALAPFAALVPAAFDHSYPDDAEIVLSYKGEPHAVLKNIDFRRAASALSSTHRGSDQ